MGLFLDTNVLVGYVFELDPWHDYAKNILNKDCKKYWSNTVCDELNIKTRYLEYGYGNLFTNIIENLNEDIFLKKDDFVSLVKNIPNAKFQEKIININNKRIADTIWEDGGWYSDVSSSQIRELIYDLLDNLPAIIALNRMECESKLEEMHSRNKQEGYSSVLNELRKARIKDEDVLIHKPDDYIILDAHDLSVKGFVSKFITADFKLLKFRNIILKCTKIKDMVSIVCVQNLAEIFPIFCHSTFALSICNEHQLLH